MNPVRSNTFKHPNEMGKNSFTDSKFKLMQNIDREYFEDVNVKLAQSQ